MSCQIGKIIIARNEGTIIFGNVNSISTNSSTNGSTNGNSNGNSNGNPNGNTASGNSVSGEVTLENARFNLNLSNDSNTSNKQAPKHKERCRKSPKK